MSNASPTNLADSLLAEGILTADQYEVIVHRVNTDNVRVEDAILENGAMTEGDLLKYLAKVHRTKFVATQKLARVEVDRALLDMIPRKVAERFTVFPILFDPNASALSVVAADPGDQNLLQAIKIAADVAREIKVYVARPAAVRAAILKHYAGDLYAFAHVDTSGREEYMTMLDMYDKHSVREDTFSNPVATAERARGERVLSEKDIERTNRGGSGPLLIDQPLIDTVTVLISLIENNRAELRGHSVLTSRWLRRMGERIKLAPAEINALVMAGLLHDLGKAATYHLTSLNVGEYEGHRQIAQRVFNMPARLMESVPLGSTCLHALGSMYERFDGKGFPDATVGKDIPLGARLLSLADTYADLTQNARNPFRRVLSPVEACDVLERYKRTVFDPNLVDLLRLTVTNDDVRARLLADRLVVLLAEPDPEESTVMELQLLENGYDVRPVRNAEAAMATLADGAVDLCVSETDLGGVSGFDVLAHAREAPWGKKLPWIFVSRDSGKEAVARGYELGAADYLIKPVANAVFLGKVRQVLAGAAPVRSGAGVSGSLSEMALTDIVQVLAQGRKTGILKIRLSPDSGEIHFLEGAVVNAMWSRLRGEEAFFTLLGLTDGEFALDVSTRPAARVISVPVEALLLEGVRRLDERKA